MCASSLKESRLNDLATKTGRPPDKLVEDAMSGYLEELSEVRSLLDTRYDDIQSGRVKPVGGEDRPSASGERRTLA